MKALDGLGRLWAVRFCSGGRGWGKGLWVRFVVPRCDVYVNMIRVKGNTEVQPSIALWRGFHRHPSNKTKKYKLLASTY